MTTTRQLIRVGHSPDPDDAFMFYALAKNKIDTGGYEFTHELVDIETLNRRAFTAELELTAVSLHAPTIRHQAHRLHGRRAAFDDVESSACERAADTSGWQFAAAGLPLPAVHGVALENAVQPSPSADRRQGYGHQITGHVDRKAGRGLEAWQLARRRAFEPPRAGERSERFRRSFVRDGEQSSDRKGDEHRPEYRRQPL